MNAHGGRKSLQTVVGKMMHDRDLHKIGSNCVAVVAANSTLVVGLALELMVDSRSKAKGALRQALPSRVAESVA
jgi:hypothetical protein